MDDELRGWAVRHGERTALVAGLTLGAIAVHSLFYNAFFEDPLAWAALGGAFGNTEAIYPVVFGALMLGCLLALQAFVGALAGERVSFHRTDRNLDGSPHPVFKVRSEAAVALQGRQQRH